MKAIFSLRRHHYLKMVSVFLIAVILIAGVVGCEGEDETYDLTMAENPAGGGTATDVTGTSPYTALTVVNISAVAAPSYKFVGWTAPLGLFADANAAETTFAMPASDVTVTANLVAKRSKIVSLTPKSLKRSFRAAKILSFIINNY